MARVSKKIQENNGFKRGGVVLHKADDRRLIVLGNDPTDNRKVVCRYAIGDMYETRSFFAEELIPQKEAHHGSNKT